MLRGGCHTRDSQNQIDQLPIIQRIIHRMNEEREKAMIYILNFFNSRMSAMNNAQRNKVKELIGLHEISAPELVNKYIELVQNNA
jgi:hypothetical protein